MTEHQSVHDGLLANDANIAILVLVLLIAATTDLRSRRIPNWLVLIGLVLSLAIKIASGNVGAWGLGLLVGLSAFMPLYLLRAMGAGDVKLMAVVGAFLGPMMVLSAIIATLVAGGVLSIVVALFKGTFRRTIENVRFMLTNSMMNGMQHEGLRIEAPIVSAGSVPYGIAIAIGTLLVIWMERVGYALFT